MNGRARLMIVILSTSLAIALLPCVMGGGCNFSPDDLISPTPDGGDGVDGATDGGDGGDGGDGDVDGGDGGDGDADGGDDGDGDDDGGDGDADGGDGGDGDDGDADGGDGGDGDDGDDDGGSDTDDGNFVAASIIHRGAGGFVADPKYGIPSGANYAEGGSIKSSIRDAIVSKDGGRIWFTTSNAAATPQAQLFCINSDGSGLVEFTLPSGLVKLPAEIRPSADGDVCALIIDACGDEACSGYMFTSSVILLADWASGTLATLLDGRNFEEGEEDFNNLQITDDGTALLFMGYDSGIIYGLSAAGGQPVAYLAPNQFVRSGSVARGPSKFRINGDASALVAVVRFEGPNNTFPRDVYLQTSAGITTLTSSGDAYASGYHNDLGVSDDARYVAYTRNTNDLSQYQVEIVDRTAGTTTVIAQGLAGHSTFLDSAGTAIFTGYRPDEPSGNVDQLPGLGTLDGSMALESHEAWLNHYATPVNMTSMSAGAGVLAGLWDNGEFGDPHRLYVWFPNVASYRGGPSITGVQYDLDTTAGTLTVRATVSGDATSVQLFAFYDNFESIYQLPQAEDPFFSERWGQDMTATEADASVYECTANLDGLTLNERFRVRIGVGDNAGKNCAYVDFRPVPIQNETVDINGDGVAD